MNTDTHIHRQKVVIVGGGFAGIEVARRLKGNKNIEVVLVSKNDTFEYYPALYRLVTGALPIEVSVPLRTIFPRGVQLITATYTGVDQVRKSITLTDPDGTVRECSYDYLVLAMGSETNYFGIPGLPELSYSFKSVTEALRLKKHFYDLVTSAQQMDKDTAVATLRCVVVGGGPSGVELAGDLKHYLMNLSKEKGVDPSFVMVDLVESNGRLLPTLPEKVSSIAEMRLRKLGVNILTNRALQSQEITEIALKDMGMKTGTVVWTAGTRISTSYDGLPLSERKRITVSPMLTLKGDTRVFVAGDGAATQYSGLAQTAIHNGTYIARSIKCLIEGKTPVPYVPHQPSFVIPIGSNWAIFNSGTFVMKGFVPWILRNAIDFRYFFSILPLSYVLAVFRKGYKYRRSHGGCTT